MESIKLGEGLDMGIKLLQAGVTSGQRGYLLSWHLTGNIVFAVALLFCNYEEITF